MSGTTLTHTETNARTNSFRIPLLSKFFTWSANQEDNRILWVAIALAAHGCVLTPLTVIAVVFAGMNMFLFMAALTAMAIALVANLAAMPTKYTIPAFAFSVLVDIAIVIACIFSGFNLANGI